MRVDNLRIPIRNLDKTNLRNAELREENEQSVHLKTYKHINL